MTEDELEIVEDPGRFSRDPYGFALWAFPWGEAGVFEWDVMEFAEYL